MIIIAWDKVTDLAIFPERMPVDGEWCRITDGNRITKKQYHETIVIVPKTVIPVTLTSITDAITSDIVTGEVVVNELTPFTIVASMPLGADTAFLVPFKRVDTGRTVYINASIVSNVMTATINLPTSGLWVCTETEINSNLDDDPFVFSFSGLDVKAIQ